MTWLVSVDIRDLDLVNLPDEDWEVWYNTVQPIDKAKLLGFTDVQRVAFRPNWVTCAHEFRVVTDDVVKPMLFGTPLSYRAETWNEDVRTEA
jgi:hypothetical protein